MATYLELVQDLARESGSIDPAAITSVTGVTGRPAKMAKWVSQAYTNIQNSRSDWRWLTDEFTSVLIPGATRYTPLSFNLTRFSEWARDREWYSPLSIYDPAEGLSDEHHIPFVSYEYWRTRYGRGDQTVEYWNRPTEWTISPKNEVVFGSVPDLAYAIRGEYQKGPQVLAANADVPEMPSRFHDLITWEARRLMDIADGAYQNSQWPQQEVITLRHQLETDQLPEVTLG